MSERTIKVGLGSASIELGAAVERVRATQREIEPPPRLTTEPIADVIQARRFILRDDAGRARGELSVQGPEGSRFPSFRLFDSSGNTAFYLATHDGDVAYMAIGHGEHQLDIWSEKEGSPISLGPDEKGTSVIIIPSQIEIHGSKQRVL